MRSLYTYPEHMAMLDALRSSPPLAGETPLQIGERLQQAIRWRLGKKQQAPSPEIVNNIVRAAGYVVHRRRLIIAQRGTKPRALVLRMVRSKGRREPVELHNWSSWSYVWRRK